MIERDTEHIVAAWRGVERISFGRVKPASKEALLEFVEGPIKEAVGILYDRNIQTISSSCNLVDLSRGFASITLDEATLSEANQRVIDSYPYHERSTVGAEALRIVGLLFPIGAMDTPDDIGRRAVNLAEQFELQPLSWISTASLDQVVRYFTKGDGSFLSEEAVIRKLTDDGFYYDPETSTFFPSEEQCQKYKAAPPAKS